MRLYDHANKTFTTIRCRLTCAIDSVSEQLLCEDDMTLDVILFLLHFFGLCYILDRLAFRTTNLIFSNGYLHKFLFSSTFSAEDLTGILVSLSDF